MDKQIQFISHYNDRYGYLDGIRMALEGGCKWVQLRVKSLSSILLHKGGEGFCKELSEEECKAALRELALEAQRMCKEAGATFIIDDNVELVKEIKADGVHLGKKDMPIAEARRILGPDFIIGGTANTFEDVKSHYESGANYIGCGPFRFTTTKQGLSPILGLEGYSSIVSRMKEEGIDLPIVAIGGITKDDIPSIMQTGVTGIALSGTVLNAEDPITEMKTLINII